MGTTTYATLSDVQDRMPQVILTESSKPSLVTAQRYLETKQSEIDAVLANLGYRLPIDKQQSPKATAQLIEAQCHGTIAAILFARAAGVQNADSAAVQSAQREQGLYDSMLKAWAAPFRDDPRSLSDAIFIDASSPKPDAITVSGLRCNEPRIWMDQRF